MKIKDIIIRASVYIGREDIAEVLKSHSSLTGECAETAETLLYCLNAVEDELARFYFPLKKKEKFRSADGRYEFEFFTEQPVRIMSVKSSGKNIDFEVFAGYMTADAQAVEVEYEYSPSKKTLDGDSAYNEQGINMIAAGTAAEFCLINGEIKLAETWESRYRHDIDGMRRKALGEVRFPPRRWV